MNDHSDRRMYNYNTYGHGIIAHNCLAKQYGECGVQVRVLCMGTFVQLRSIRDEDVLFFVVHDDMQADGTQMVGKKTDIINVPDSLWGPLFTLNKMARLPLVRDPEIAENLGNISVGHIVQVLGLDGEVVCLGDVTFKNSIARLGVGIFFGLKVLDPKENLQSLIEKVSLLEPGTKGFPRGCDLVVTIDKIRPTNIGKEKSMYNCDRENQKRLVKNLSGGEDVNNGMFKSMISFKFSNTSKKSYHPSSPDAEFNMNHSSKRMNSDESLSVGDQVIFLDGDTPEKGVVRWIGNIGNNLKVGVEFDNPIGSGTGILEGVGELFKAKFNHALVLPPLALIKLGDYVANSTKETKKNNNNKYNNNINNNNNNINNNSDYRPSDICCKQNNEERCRVARKVSVSHQCLKHPERTFDCNESKFQEMKDFIKNGHRTELESQHYSKSFDYVTSGERKPSHRRSCSSVDNELPQNKDSKMYWTQTSLDLYESSGIKHEKSPCYYDDDKKSQKCLDDDSIFHGVFSHSNEKNSRSFSKKELLSKKSNSQSGDEIYDVPSSDVRRVSCAGESPCCCKGLCRDCHKNTYKEDFYKGRRHTLAHAGRKHGVSEWMLLHKDNWDSQYSEFSSSEENLQNFHDPPKPPYSGSHIPEDLGKGSVVELTFKGEPHFGVIRWIGTIPDEREDSTSHLIAGVEMEEESSAFTDGTFNNKRYFTCNPRKALFLPLSKCRKDSRFLDETQRQNLPSKVNYGQIDCPVVEGTIPPINRKGDIESICGKNRGIQGHHNSCYLDATLFSMFSFTSVFDSLLYRPPTKNDIPQYSEVQRVLREEIVNPLRKNLYVRADRVMKLRTLLDKLSSVSGLTSEEKDPEEFLNCLLAQILKAEPFLKLSSGQEAFHYQLFVEKDERLVLPSVQQLFEQSFVTSDIKLKQVPSCLIIQMPRFGKSFKMYSRILPPQLLDITDIIENSPRQCTVCGQLAEFECKDCFGQQGIGNGLESISFCKSCLETAHSHHCRTRHNSRALTVPLEFSELQEHCIIPRLYMELFAVVCIETSHYVAFVKCGSGSDAPWCFFDSMADRKGEQNGYNIPEMVPCPDLTYWLSEDGAKMLNEMRDERQLPEHAKRLFSDAYMCMYQSPDLMMYR